MSEADWRTRAGTTFRCEKQPATGTRGMVVTNHPLASAAGAEMLAAGGNAIDAAIAALFTLTVVEPMMVGILGGGMAHIRLADGRHRGDRQPEHGAARHRPDHLHARSERRARHDGYDRPQERRRPDRGRRARQPEGLVRGVAPLRHLLAGRCHGAGDPPCLARLPRHALPARMRFRLRRRHGARPGDRAAVSAGRRADRCRHAAGHRRLCRDAAHHRAGRSGSAVRRRARDDLRRPHGEVRRLHHAATI